MLRTIKELHDYAIGAVDGVIGHVKDLYLDDEAWVVRYLVVDAGGWLSSKKVLISPIAIGNPDWAKRLLPVSITKEQVRNSPNFDSEKPVTRQHEMEYSSYYGYPYYWDGMGYWGGDMYPNMMLSGYGGIPARQAEETEARDARARADASRDDNANPHLRSCAAVTGYHIHASDGDIGHVSGMLIDDETWAVRYLIVDTSNWWVGHRMLVAPPWIEDVSWAAGAVSIKLTRQAVKDAPAYNPVEIPSRADEARLHEYYGRTGYWAEADKRETEISRV
ncbi:MAG: PRC-barrel domain-containing protein [Burkholderiaceae bacterium]